MFVRNLMRTIPRLFAPTPKLDLQARDEKPGRVSVADFSFLCDCQECQKARAERMAEHGDPGTGEGG